MKIDLRQFRTDNNLKQTDIAKMFGTGQPNVANIEKYNRPLTEEQYQILINNFGKNKVNEYLVSENDSSPEEQHISISSDLLELIKQQTQIISSQQEVIQSQQKTIDFLAKRSPPASTANGVNAV